MPVLLTSQICENDASRMVIDDSRVKLQIVASFTDDSRGIIYDRNMFIVQATGVTSKGKQKVTRNNDRH